MRKYEIMYIVRPTLSAEEIKNVIDSFNKVLTSNKATIVSTNELGQKELAYEIKNFRTGFYCVCVVEANDDKAINEFNRLAKNSNDIIRHLITKLED